MTQYSKIHFSDINNGWILSSEILDDYIENYESQPLLSVLHTTNSGVNWDLITLSLNDLISSVYAVQSFDKTVNFDSICFLNDKVGYIARHSKRILLTVDGGLTWNEQKWVWTDSLKDSQVDGYNSNINGFRDVQLIDSSRGWAIGGGYGGDMFMKTTDGGKSCVRIETGFRL